MNGGIKSLKIEDKKTGKLHTAIYAHNRLGNLRMWVNGKFYSDKDFIRKFKNHGEEKR